LSTVVDKIPPMAERAFRALWVQTEKPGDHDQRTITPEREHERFDEVIALIQGLPPKPPPAKPRTKEEKAGDEKLAERIARRFGDDEWRSEKTLINQLKITPEDLPHGIKRITNAFRVEKRGGGGKEEYRIRPVGRSISSLDLIEGLGMLIGDLVKETHKAATHPVYYEPKAMHVLALTIKQAFDKLTR
jgi:hypothetical protein